MEAAAAAGMAAAGMAAAGTAAAGMVAPAGGGPAVVGGLAAGALLAAPYYGYGGSCNTYTPMYDAYGNYIGQQLVNVC